MQIYLFHVLVVGLGRSKWETIGDGVELAANSYSRRTCMHRNTDAGSGIAGVVGHCDAKYMALLS